MPRRVNRPRPKSDGKNTTMLFQEFADRTYGEFTTEEDYNNANAIYMMDTDLDKDQFCAIWKEYHNNPLVSIMTKQMQSMSKQAHTDAQHIHQLEVNLAEEREHNQTLIETIEQNAKADAEGMTNDMAAFLIETADRHCDDLSTSAALRDKARRMLGDRKYYATLMLVGCPDADDMKAVASLLTQND